MTKLRIRARLPPGYGDGIESRAKAGQGFRNLAIVMLICIAMIYVALVFQFKHAIKPAMCSLRFRTASVGSLAALLVMGAPFGFMAFLVVASLIGVIVSHIIVLFDFIEERHKR